MRGLSQEGHASSRPGGESPPISGASDPACLKMARNGRKGHAILGTGSGRSAQRMARQCMTAMCGTVKSRNPTAVQSGNRFATPLGERPRAKHRGNRLCELLRKEWFMLSGPRRAQAGSNLPTASARDQRSGSERGSVSALLPSNLTRPTR